MPPILFVPRLQAGRVSSLSFIYSPHPLSSSSSPVSSIAILSLLPSTRPTLPSQTQPAFQCTTHSTAASPSNDSYLGAHYKTHSSGYSNLRLVSLSLHRVASLGLYALYSCFYTLPHRCAFDERSVHTEELIHSKWDLRGLYILNLRETSRKKIIINSDE